MASYHAHDLRDGTSSRCSDWFLADGTDDADGLFATRPYANDPITGSTLTTKRNVDADRPKERLRATQSAGKNARISGPVGAVTALARPLNADPQKIGSAARPKAALGH
jgi:hypothetical protein